MKNIQWEKIKSRSVEILKDLIRFDTTNPPGNEAPAMHYVAGLLKEAGFETNFIESAPNRGNVITRLAGKGKRGPLLLQGHLDVVPAEPNRWSVDPFAAVEKNGSLYGRGAVDMKGTVAQSLTALLALKELEIAPERDIIFAAVSDEETGCEMGSKYLVENKKELIEAEYSLGEVGGFSVYNKGGRTVYPIGVAEKGALWVEMKVSGDPGHGSMPHGNNAVVKLSRIVAEIGAHGLPVHKTKVTERFIEGVATAQPFPKSKLLKLLLQPSLTEKMLKILPEQNRNQFNAMLRNTVTPTVISAGVKTNVIPSEASVQMDIRILPGFDKESVLKELRKITGNGVSIKTISYSPPTQEADVNTPLYKSIRKTIEKNDPGCVVAPYLIPGYTDARWYSKLGTKCYGYSPLKMNPDDDVSFGELVHGHDERVWVEGYKWGMQTYLETLLDFLYPL